jgi:hypothetical protein
VNMLNSFFTGIISECVMLTPLHEVYVVVRTNCAACRMDEVRVQDVRQSFSCTSSDGGTVELEHWGWLRDLLASRALAVPVTCRAMHVVYFLSIGRFSYISRVYIFSYILGSAFCSEARAQPRECGIQLGCNSSLSRACN